MNVRARIERLQKQFPGNGVGLVIFKDDGWTATRGRMQVHFSTQDNALAVLQPCENIIIIDV